MKEIKIKEGNNISIGKTFKSQDVYIKLNNKDNQSISYNQIELKNYYYLYLFLLITFIISKIFEEKPIIKDYKIFSLEPYLNYINNCTELKYFNRTKIKNKNPYLSVCLPVCNMEMEKNIEKTILSIINQSFQDFEIIIINDFPNFNTYNNIIKRLRNEDDRIKIINHSKKLGVYASRVEAIYLSKGKYIILMNPDEMFLNEYILQELYNYNLKKNLDIIEFLILNENQKRQIIYNPNSYRKIHYHNFPKDIIYQPELSNILFKNNGIIEFNQIICTNISNKLIKKEVLKDMIDYIGYNYYSEQIVITDDDILMNIISYHFAHNYSNINIPGYLYMRRDSSSFEENNTKVIKSKNYFFFLKIYYKYIKEFNKDRDFLYLKFYEISNKLFPLKYYKKTKYKTELICLLDEIINDNYISNDFKKHVFDLLLYFKYDDDMK